MTQAIATVTAAICAFVFIACATFVISVQTHRHNNEAVRYEQIKTDSTTHYATLASTGRCNFVEMTR